MVFHGNHETASCKIPLPPQARGLEIIFHLNPENNQSASTQDFAHQAQSKALLTRITLVLGLP